jgi:hypothetical protein
MPSHGAYFLLEDPTFPDAISGQIAFDTPAPVDANGDGFDDFFQVSQAVAESTRGLFMTPVDQGTVTATWSRGAGSTTGSCRLSLVGEMFGELPEFTHSFQLLEYKGNLNYTAGTNAITGRVDLVQTEAAANTLSGILTFTRVATNRFNQLTLRAAALTNAASQPMPFATTTLDRDQLSKTNYFGYLDFADGDPATSTADYVDWILSIDDPNDANANGIPDLSDDASSSSPRPPQLGLSRSGNQLLLSISGESGQSYTIQQTSTLNTTNWLKSVSLTLTNDSQEFPLPLPTEQTSFWRATAP